LLLLAVLAVAEGAAAAAEQVGIKQALTRLRLAQRQL
jgi:hypothetical protein